MFTQRHLFFSIFCCLASNLIMSQIWTEKNEDENYTARHEFGFTQVGDKFYMFGGRENPQGIEIYDYTANSWSTGSLAPHDFNHFQAITYEGLIWVLGAFQTNDSPEINATHVYMYNPAINQWIQGIPIPKPRQRGSAGVALYNNKFYIVGGNTTGHNGGYVSYFDEYNPTTGIWTILTDSPRPRDHFHAVVFNDKLYAIGGRLTGGTGGLFEPQVEEVDIYNFSNDSWSTLDASKNIPHPRAGLTACFFQGEIFTIGGESTFGSPTNTNGPRDVVEAFNPITETWSSKSSLNQSRHGMQAIVSGDGVFVTGGSSGSTIKNMEFYNIDNPQGNPLIGSVFVADETVKIFQYEETDGSVSIEIILSNSSGDTGTFIDTIEITGANFSLDQTYNNLFLNSNSSITIEAILNDTTQPESNGEVTVTYNNNSTLTILLDGESNTLSVTDFENLNKSLIIYPLPTSSNFSINKPITHLEIYSISGKLIKTFKGNFDNESVFNVNNLNTGLYIIVTKDANNKREVIKLIKE